MADKNLFFVILDEESNCYCIVAKEDVLSEASVEVEVGDVVRFYWSDKKILKGTVKHMNDTYDACKEKSKELKLIEKGKSKREDSFHADKPRKSSVRCKERISRGSASTSSKRKREQTEKESESKDVMKAKQTRGSKESPEALAANKRDKKLLDIIDNFDKKIKKGVKKAKNMEVKPSKSEVNPKKVTKKSQRKKVVIISDDEDDDHDSSSSSSSSPSTSSEDSDDDDDDDDDDDKKEVKKLSASLAAKYDLETLRKMACGVAPSSTDAKLPEAVSDQITTAASQPSTSNVASPTLSTPLAGHSAQPSPQVQERSPQQFPLGKVVIFEGDMYLIKPPHVGKVLDEKNNIQCDQSTYDEAEASNSATQVGRKLLEGVFTTEALNACSISGLPPRGRGKASYTDKTAIKPALCPRGVKAIIDEAKRLQSARHWKPKKDDSQIRHAMSVRLNEIVKKSNLQNDSDI